MLAFHGEIAGHHVGNEAAGIVVEMKLEIVFRLLEMLGLFSRLEDLSDDRPGFAARVGAFVRGDQSR